MEKNKSDHTIKKEEYHIKNINNNIYSILKEEIDLDIEIKIEDDEDFETDLITIIPESPKRTNERVTKQNHVMKKELTNLPEDEEKILLNLNEVETYQCTVCKVNLKSKQSLYFHYEEIHSLKPCQYCLKVFNKTSNLKRHQDYSCTKNELVSKNNEVLKYGMFSHRFICDFCKKSYSHKNTLKQHIASHMGLPKYKCKHCEKSYTKRHNLTCHVRSTHLKVKSYSCKHCLKRFSWRFSLTNHMNKHHKEKRSKT